MKNRLFFLILIIFNSFFSYSQLASISGRIVDAENNEPVSFASVQVLDTQKGTSSDVDGKFKIEGIKPGYIKLKVSFVGYKALISEDVLVSPSNNAYIELKMEQDAQQLDEVVVKVDFFEKKQESLISMQSIGIKEIESNPGSNRDISRVIQSFPGVGSTPAFRNDVIIRGGGPSENRFYLDNIEIPVLNHFSTQGASGGPVGIINADFIRSVDFYSSSFPSAKYNALSGVLDFKLKEGSMENTNFQFSLGASETAFTVDGHIGSKTNYIFSVRRSYLQFLFSAIGLPFLPTFNDYQLKVKTNLNKRNQLTIISLGALDQLTLNNGIKNPTPSQDYILSQIPVNNQWSYVIGGVYKNFFKTGYHTFVLSRNMLDNQFYKYPNNDETKERVFDYNSQEIENKFRYELNLNKGGYKMNFSINSEYAKYFNETKQQVFVQNQLTTFAYNSDFNMWKYGLSAQVSKRFDRLTASLGVRTDGSNYNNSMKNLLNQLSPRLSLSYALAEGLTVNSSAGRYYQLPAYTTLGYKVNNVFANKNTAKYIGLEQYNLGVEKKFSRKALVSVEAFYKNYFQYPIDMNTGASLANSGAEYSSIAGTAEAIFSGKGKAYGVEILNRWNLKNLNLLASYTYVRSLFTDIKGDFIPSSWDSRHLLTITGSREFKGNWSAGLKYRLVGGLPYTPYDLDKSAYIDAWDVNGGPYLDYSQLNAQRLSTFNQLDIRIDKNFFFKNFSLMLYVDIQNALNTKYQGQDFVVRKSDGEGNYTIKKGQGQYVLEQYPSESGTVLPTVGIIFKF